LGVVWVCLVCGVGRGPRAPRGVEVEGRREGQVRERREERDEEEERVADCLKMNKNKNNNAASSRALFQSSIAWLVYL